MEMRERSIDDRGTSNPLIHPLEHTGYSTARGPLNPELEWRLDLSGEIISSPVLGPDGTIYLGSVIKDTRHPEHFITAVNADGTIKWRFSTGWWDTQTQSSPRSAPTVGSTWGRRTATSTR